MLALRKKIWIGIGIFFLLFLLAAGVLLYLVTRDDSAGKYSAEPSADLMGKGIAAALSGEETEITEQELNAFLAGLFSKGEAQQGPLQLHSLYLTLGMEEGDAGVYAPCSYHGISVAVTARATITYEKEQKRFCAEIRELKAGRLGLPPGMALSMVAGKLPSGVAVEGNRLYVAVSHLKPSQQEERSPLNIEEFAIRQRCVCLKTSGVRETIEHYIKEKLGGLLGGNPTLAGQITQKLESWLGQFLDGDT